MGRNPSPAESSLGTCSRKCVHRECPMAATRAEGKCGRPSHHPLRSGSCRDGSPLSSAAGHTQSTEGSRRHSAPLQPCHHLQSPFHRWEGWRNLLLFLLIGWGYSCKAHSKATSSRVTYICSSVKCHFLPGDPKPNFLPSTERIRKAVFNHCCCNRWAFISSGSEKSTPTVKNPWKGDN